jgi:hypothetical protein
MDSRKLSCTSATPQAVRRASWTIRTNWHRRSAGGGTITIRRLAAASLLLVVGTLAQAATLTTPPLESNFTLYCRIVNLGDTALPVTIQGFDTAGALTSDGDVVVQPNAVGAWAVGTTASWCRFTFNGSKRKVRASAQMVDFDTEGVFGPVVEAR